MAQGGLPPPPGARVDFQGECGPEPRHLAALRLGVPTYPMG